MKGNARASTAVLTAPLVMLWRRIRASWRLLAVLFAGVLLATTLLAGAPVYLGAVKELGLRHSLKLEKAGVLDTAVSVLYRPLDPTGYDSIRQRIERPVDESIGSLVVLRVAHIETPDLEMRLPQAAGALPATARGSLQSFSEYEKHARLVEGVFPMPGAEPGKAGAVVQVAIGRQSARTFRLKLGDEVALSQGSGNLTRTLGARVVGIVEAADPRDQYWSFAVDPFIPRVAASGGDEIPSLPMLIPHDSFFQDLPSVLRGALVNYWWYFYVDQSLIDAGNVDQVHRDIKRLETTLGIDVPGANVFSGLTETLDNFDSKLFFSRIPILVMLILVISLVLYYLVMVASVVIDRQLGEIALLRSRGANTAQVLLVHIWDAALICGAASVLGPLLAMGLVPLLGKTPPFQSVTAGGLLPVRFTGQVLLLSGMGAALAFIALLLPALRGARFNLLHVRKAMGRPPSSVFFHRYFLDLFMLALAGILYWELTQRGSLVTRKIFGGDSTDYLLLAAPALFIMGMALALLRLLPLAIRILSLVASLGGRVWLVMGLWTMGRDPVHHIRLTLLLTMVVSTAMFAGSFNATVDQSFRDRGLYRSGSDARLVSLPPYLSANARSLPQQLEKEPEVRQAASVYRLEPRGFSSPGERSYDLLAVDTINFNRVAWYRDDFSEHSLFSLLRQLDRGRSIARGLELPKGFASIGLWVKPAKAYPNMSLWVRLRDADGGHWRLRLDRLDFDEWRFLRADLASLREGGIKEPVALESVFLWEFDFPKEPLSMDLLMLGSVSSGQLNLSGLMAFTAENPRGTMIDPLESPSQWQPMAISALAPETLQASKEVMREGRQSSEFSWQSAPGVGIRGIYPSDLREPLPVVAGGRFLASTGRRVGETLEISVAGIPVPVKIVDEVDFFPTMDPRQPFVLANVDTVLHYANLFRGPNPVTPNEVWLSLVEDRQGRDAFLARLKGSAYGPYLQLDRDEELEQLADDPLVGTGSRAIVFTTFIVLVLVAAGGYLGYVYVASSRTSLEFAVIKALGWTNKQLAALQLLVHGVVVLTAAVLGAWIGVRAYGMMITFLQHTERGRQVLPPLAPHTSWAGLEVMLAASAIIVGVLLAWLMWTFAKVSIWKVLRGGGEQS